MHVTRRQYFLIQNVWLSLCKVHFFLCWETRCTASLSTRLARLLNLNVVHFMLPSASNITKFNAGNQPDEIDAVRVSSTPLPRSPMTRISFSGPAARRTGSQTLKPERCESANQPALHSPVLHICVTLPTGWQPFSKKSTSLMPRNGRSSIFRWVCLP
jgi:hypothetical protein